MTNEIFKYNGNPISFRNENGEVFVNATEMAEPFNKSPMDWIRLGATQEFLIALREVRNPHITPKESVDLIITERGNFSDGREQCTWKHEDVALEFDRCRSLAFTIW